MPPTHAQHDGPSASPAGGTHPLLVSVLVVLALALAALGLNRDELGGLALRDAEGLPTTDFWLPLAAAGALGLTSLILACAGRASALWAGLLVAGQIATLQLTLAGREVIYDNVSLSDTTGLQLLPLGFLAMQAALVAAGLWRERIAASRALTWVGWIRGAALVGLGTLASLAFFTDLASWLGKSVFLAAAQTLALANAFLLLRAWPAGDLTKSAKTNSLLGEGDPPSPAFDRFAWGQALLATLVTGLLAFFVYDRHPHVPDEVVYLLHAEYLAEGAMTRTAPPIPEGFEVDLMLLDGERWFCPVPPGWPAVLAVGQFAGLPWLVNPGLAGLAALLLHGAFRELFDRPTARLASLLLLASPWFLFLGMSFMPHTLTLAATSAVILGVARARPGDSEDVTRGTAKPRSARRQVAWAAAAGCAIGVIALIRPLEGLVVALSAGLWGLGIGGQRLRFPPLVALVLGAAFVGATVLPYNHALTGDATKFPIMDYVDKLYGADKNALGFGDERGLSWGGLDPYPGHHLRDVLVNAQFNATSVDRELFGWSVGALIPLALLAFRRRFSPGERALSLLAALVVLAHSLYWFAGGPDFGARYWYPVLPACLAIAARGLLAERRATSDRDAKPDEAESRLGLGASPLRTRLLLTAAVLAASAFATHVPWRIFDRYLHYRGMRADVRDIVADLELGRSLVLIEGWRHPDYASAVIYNGTNLEADGPIFAWDQSREVRERLLAHYADREVYLLQGPTRTGNGYQITLGPLAADAPELKRGTLNADLPKNEGGAGSGEKSE